MADDSSQTIEVGDVVRFSHSTDQREWILDEIGDPPVYFHEVGSGLTGLRTVRGAGRLSDLELVKKGNPGR